MSPSSAKQRLFKPPVSPKLWREELRATTAIQQLRSGHWDQFPLNEVQKLTTALLRSPKNRIWGSGGVEPRTEECHILVVQALDGFKGELWAYAAGVVACLHVMTANQCHGHLKRLQDLCIPDETFIHHTRDYFQCLLLASTSQPEYFHPDVHDTARDLLLVVTMESELPSFLRVLRAFGENMCEEFLPLALVRTTLHYTNYKTNLEMVLKPLVEGRRWLQVYNLVGALDQVVQLEPARRLLPYVVPEPQVPMWVSWSPNRDRMSMWENPILDEFRESLAPVMDLEGPDYTGGHRRTYRDSSPGIFGQHVLWLPRRGNDYILDHVLTVLDRAISRGVEAIRLFITLCVEPKTLDWQVIEKLEVALSLDSPFDIGVLDAYVRALKENNLLKSMPPLTKALHTMQPSAVLQRFFGETHDIKHRARHILYEAQLYLSRELLSGKTNEWAAYQLGDLAHALLSSTWLHDAWPAAYVNRLRIVPKKPIIASIFRTMQTASSDLKMLCEDFLVIALYSSRIDGAQLQLDTLTVVGLALNDPVWQKSLESDSERNHLRDMILVTMIQGFSPADATTCLKQADLEHDTFVRELRELLGSSSGDMVCITLAAFLANRCGKRRLADCWRRLLMHMMRQRAPDLHTRCAVKLTSKAWAEWTRHLLQLFEDRNFEPERGLGFTLAELSNITLRKTGVSRMASTSTYSTASTGPR